MRIDARPPSGPSRRITKAFGFKVEEQRRVGGASHQKFDLGAHRPYEPLQRDGVGRIARACAMVMEKSRAQLIGHCCTNRIRIRRNQTFLASKAHFGGHTKNVGSRANFSGKSWRRGTKRMGAAIRYAFRSGSSDTSEFKLVGSLQSMRVVCIEAMEGCPVEASATLLGLACDICTSTVGSARPALSKVIHWMPRRGSSTRAAADSILAKLVRAREQRRTDGKRLRDATCAGRRTRA